MNISKKNPTKAVVFDLYGTLLEDFPFDQHRKCFEKIADIFHADAEKCHFIWQDHYAQYELGQPSSLREIFEEICRQLNVGCQNEQIERASACFLDFLRTIPIQDGAIETLRTLQSLGIGIGLISNTGPATAKTWRQHELAQWINAPVFSCEVQIKKPNPKIYHIAAEKLRCRPEEIAYVGDGGSFELQGATEAGMCAILLKRREDRPDPYGFYKETQSWRGLKIKKLSELPNLLEIQPSPQSQN